MSDHSKLYEVFVRSRRGLDHKHVGSLHADDPAQALEYALSGGEDYELLFTLPPDRDVPEGVTVIGIVEAGEGVYCDVMSREQGYDHFH